MSRWSPRIACRRRVAALATCLLWASGCSEPESQPVTVSWSQSQLQLLRSLSLAALREPPEPHSNRVASDPRAARLGQRLFFEPGLGANGEVACVSCHVPALHFSDGLHRS